MFDNVFKFCLNFYRFEDFKERHEKYFTPFHLTLLIKLLKKLKLLYLTRERSLNSKLIQSNRNINCDNTKTSHTQYNFT